MDDYYHPTDDPHHIYLDKFGHHDWDSLNALDIDRFVSDFQSNRLKYCLLLVEGFLIFNISSLSQENRAFDLAYYFDLIICFVHFLRLINVQLNDAQLE